MANSESIYIFKDKVMRKLIQNNDIVSIIDANVESPSDLINTHIFNYAKNPKLITDSITFITLSVHIPKVNYSNNTFVYPQLEIWIFSHNSHMDLDASITTALGYYCNRNDYLSSLIDKLLNGNDFGVGELKLIANTEETIDSNYNSRRMVFVGIDLNNSICN